MRDMMCSSHTVSGVMPGSPRAARHSLDDRLAACHKAGFRGLWLHFRDYLEQRTARMSDRDIRGLFDEYGMRNRGVEFVSDWFLDTDAAGDNLAATLSAARAIGATIISVGGNFSDIGVPRVFMVERFAQLCRHCADDGITVALEFVPWSDVPDIRTALDFMEPDNAGIVIDCWHLFRGGMSVSDILQVPSEKIACIQMSDAPARSDRPLAEETRWRLPCGEGAFDLEGFVSTLEKVAPRVPASVEIISPRLAAMPVGEAAELAFIGAARLCWPGMLD